MKIAVDTNILVRLITKDNKPLLEKATHVLDSYDTGEIFVVSGVVFELYFVLKALYKQTDEWILNELENLMRVDTFSFEHEVALRTAFMKCRKGQPFKDAVLGEIAMTRNVKTLTFDRKLKSNSSFIVLKTSVHPA